MGRRRSKKLRSGSELSSVSLSSSTSPEGVGEAASVQQQYRQKCHQDVPDKAQSDKTPHRRRKPKKLARGSASQPARQCAAGDNLRRHSGPTVRPQHALVRSTHSTPSDFHTAELHRAHRSHSMAEEYVQNDSGPHPLQFKWTLWHDFVTTRTRSSSNYAVNLRPIASFDTVEDFWAVFNSLKEPSQLPVNHTYNLFKFGIDPKWEDPQNVDGGEWRVTFPTSHGSDLDKCWINTILTVIGEGFGPQESDDIAGIVMNRKKGINRLAIWTKTAIEKELQMRIGSRWRETSGVAPDQQYLMFKDMISGGKKAKARYGIPPFTDP